MSSYDHCSPSSQNAFSPTFLQRAGERDEPPTAGEADASGPWRVLELPGRGFGVFRIGESPERGYRPAAVLRERWLALLTLAVLPGTGREAAFRLAKEEGPEGYAVELGTGGVVGHLELFDENLIAALHVVDALVRSPAALADLLEAAGQLALERAGAILDERVG